MASAGPGTAALRRFMFGRQPLGADGVAWVCALVAGLAGLWAALASQDGWFRPSALVKLSTADPLRTLALAHDSSFSLVTPAEHYDGVYYYAMALDPFAAGKAHTLIDQASYRYGHPLHGWIAGLLSLGRASAVPGTLLFMSVAGLAIAGWVASRLAHALGGSPWVGLAVATSPGLLYSATVDTTEALGAAIVLGALLAWHYRRWTLGLVLIICCCLDKEQYVTVPLGLAAWELAGWLKSETRPAALVPKVLALVAGPVVLAAWYLYVHAQLDRWPFGYESGNIGQPAAGWVQSFRYGKALSASGDFNGSQIGAITAPILIVYLFLLGAAAVAALRLRTVMDATLLAMILITACQGWRTLLYPHEIFRTPAIVVLLSVIVLLTRHRQQGLVDEASSSAAVLPSSAGPA